MTIMPGNEKRKPVVLLTGFGPFNEYKENPSWDYINERIVKKVDNVLSDICEVHCKELVVSYEHCATNTPRLQHELKPDITIHTGVALPNQFAVENKCRNGPFDKPDHYKDMRESHKVVPELDIDHHYMCRMNLPKIVEDASLKIKKTIHTKDPVVFKVSNDAGLYLCEYNYFLSSHARQQPVVFFHIPPFNEPWTKEEIFDTCDVIVKTIVEDCIKQFSL
eukprot:Clim_evm16s197 gene=Clim_evmTU16s197